MLDIVELQRKLTENRNLQIEHQQQQQSINAQQYRLRTAALEKEREREIEKERQKQARERDVTLLLNEGYNADQASYIGYDDGGKGGDVNNQGGTGLTILKG